MSTTERCRPFAGAVALAAACVFVVACNDGGPAKNTPPTASFTATPATGVSPQPVALDASASIDQEGPIAAYAWDFGDGSATATGVTASHVYSSPGSFTVTLTVTDRKGATGTASNTITVKANTPPTASFTATPTRGRAPLTVSFDGSASSDPDGSIVSYVWTYGNGVSYDGTVAQKENTYWLAGRYQATLKVTDDRGGVGAATALVVVTLDKVAEWYSVTEIPPSARACVTPTSVNDLGMVAGYYYDPADGSDPTVHAFLFDGRSSRDLGTLGGEKAYAWDLNDHGEVVGDAQTAAGNYRAFLYTKGTMRDLGALNGWVSGARGINNAGQVVGFWVGDYQLAFLYENGQMRSLGSPGTDSYAAAISENGTVAGVWFTRFPYGLPRNLFTYRDGAMIDLGGATIEEVGGINDAGDVVGAWRTECMAPAGFLYRGGVLQPLFSCHYSPATGISNEGVVVGYFDLATFEPGSLGTAAYVWDRTNGWRNLNRLIDPTLGVKLDVARSINDLGQIVAVEKRAAGQCDRALLLTPAVKP